MYLFNMRNKIFRFYDISTFFIDIIFFYDRICFEGAIKYGRTADLQSGSTSPVYIYGKLCRFTERRKLQMITISLQTIYYAVAIASILCGAAYKLGYEIGKNAKK